MAPLLDVQNLHVSYAARTGQCSTALANVSFALQPGETLGVLGESGSGKSTLAAALLRVLLVKRECKKAWFSSNGGELFRAHPRHPKGSGESPLTRVFHTLCLGSAHAVQSDGQFA